MKIYEQSEVDQAFKNIIKLIDDGADLLSLRTFGGRLSLTIASRLIQLKNGSAISMERDLEISKLEDVMRCLTFKLNTSTSEDIARDVVEAYKVYAMQ